MSDNPHGLQPEAILVARIEAEGAAAKRARDERDQARAAAKATVKRNRDAMKATVRRARDHAERLCARRQSPYLDDMITLLALVEGDIEAIDLPDVE